MNRKKSKISPLIAARVNTCRRRPSGPAPSQAAPFLRLSAGASADAQRTVAQSAVPLQIHALLTKSQRVIHAAEISECNTVAELRLLQESIDATVDAISALIAGLNQDDRKRLVIGGTPNLLALRTRGRL